MINYRDKEEFIPPFLHPSYIIFVDKYRERYKDEWPEEWSYRAECVNRKSSHNIVIATGREGFARAISRQLQGLTSFVIHRKKLSGVEISIRSYEDHSEQVALPDDNELAELEFLIRSNLYTIKPIREGRNVPVTPRLRELSVPHRHMS